MSTFNKINNVAQVNVQKVTSHTYSDNHINTPVFLLLKQGK